MPKRKGLHQTGTSNIEIDKRFKALKPGKRISKKSKKVYYEYRKNRTDLIGRI